jgi:hypothetical protein
MRDQFAQFLLGEPIVERAAEMADKLFFAAERDQGRDRDQAAVALRQALALPDVAINDLLGEVDELGRTCSRVGEGGVIGIPEIFYGSGKMPFDIVVERDDRARQALPVEAVEHRRSQAGQVDFDDLLGPKELVEPAAEMAA